MADYEEVLAQARLLGPEERRRLAQALAPALAPQLAQWGVRPPAPQSAGWVKAERGHAVLATESGPDAADLPVGAEAIAGMWADVLRGGVASEGGAAGGTEAGRTEEGGAP